MINIKNLIFLIFKILFLFLYLICIIFLFVTIFIIPKNDGLTNNNDDIIKDNNTYKIISIIPSIYNVAIKLNHENNYQINYPHYYIKCIYTNLGDIVKSKLIETVSEMLSKNFGDILLQRYRYLYFARYFSNDFNYTLNYNITKNSGNFEIEIEMTCLYILKFSMSDIQVYFFLANHLLIFGSYLFVFIFYQKYTTTYREKILLLICCIFVLLRIVYIDIIKIFSIVNIIHESSAIQQVINFIVLFSIDIIIFIFQVNINYKIINTVLPYNIRRYRKFLNVSIIIVLSCVGFIIVFFSMFNFFGGFLYNNILNEFIKYIPDENSFYNTYRLCENNEYTTCDLTYSLLIKALKYIPNITPIFITFHFVFNVIYGKNQNY